MMARMDLQLDEMEIAVETNQEEVNAIDLEANLEEMESRFGVSGVPKKDAAVETFGALKDRYGDRHLAVGSRQQLKKRTQGNGGSRKKLVARRRMTSRAGTARHKGHGRQGPGHSYT
jgi:L-fucose isomerase-like protein